MPAPLRATRALQVPDGGSRLVQIHEAKAWSTSEAAEWMAYRKASLPQTQAVSISREAAQAVSISRGAAEAVSRQRRYGTEPTVLQDCEQRRHGTAVAQGRLLQPVYPDEVAPTERIPKRYRQPHMLQVELGGLGLKTAALDTQRAWYETITYIVTLHPSSVRLPHVCLPVDVPCPSSHTDCLISQPQVSLVDPAPETDVATIEFSERLAMHTDKLDSHFVLFLWCRRSSVFHESSVLLGGRPLPLREERLYARWASWDIHDVETGEEVGQMNLKLDVFTAPSSIRLPHLEDVTDSGFTLNWSVPLGQPVTGYSVTVRESGIQRTAPLIEKVYKTSLEVDGLLAGGTYLVSIRAFNELGWGESCELEASTLLSVSNRVESYDTEPVIEKALEDQRSNDDCDKAQDDVAFDCQDSPCRLQTAQKSHPANVADEAGDEIQENNVVSM